MKKGLSCTDICDCALRHQNGGVCNCSIALVGREEDEEEEENESEEEEEDSFSSLDSDWGKPWKDSEDITH